MAKTIREMIENNHDCSRSEGCYLDYDKIAAEIIAEIEKMMDINEEPKINVCLISFTDWQAFKERNGVKK